jgi:transcriptional regulator with XRE-family HTH domain
MTQRPHDCDSLDIKVIGHRLRHSRQLKRLRLKDVAHAIGCSESMLSKIECGKARPSLEMLHKMATAVDTSIGALFNGPATGDLVVYSRGQRQTINIGAVDDDQAVRLEQLVPYASDRVLGGNLHVVKPGASNGGAIKHEGEEVGFVISGSLELTVSDETVVLNAGDSFFFRSQLPHSYRNSGTEIASVVWINSPPTF